MGSSEDAVVRSIHHVFEALPAKSKPRLSTSAVQEWVPLSGIAVVDGSFPGNWPDI